MDSVDPALSLTPPTPSQLSASYTLMGLRSVQPFLRSVQKDELLLQKGFGLQQENSVIGKGWNIISEDNTSEYSHFESEAEKEEGCPINLKENTSRRSRFDIEKEERVTQIPYTEGPPSQSWQSSGMELVQDHLYGLPIYSAPNGVSWYTNHQQQHDTSEYRDDVQEHDWISFTNQQNSLTPLTRPLANSNPRPLRITNPDVIPQRVGIQEPQDPQQDTNIPRRALTPLFTDYQGHANHHYYNPQQDTNIPHRALTPLFTDYQGHANHHYHNPQQHEAQYLLPMANFLGPFNTETTLPAVGPLLESRAALLAQQAFHGGHHRSLLGHQALLGCHGRVHSLHQPDNSQPALHNDYPIPVDQYRCVALSVPQQSQQSQQVTCTQYATQPCFADLAYRDINIADDQAAYSHVSNHTQIAPTANNWYQHCFAPDPQPDRPVYPEDYSQQQGQLATRGQLTADPQVQQRFAAINRIQQPFGAPESPNIQRAQQDRLLQTSFSTQSFMPQQVAYGQQNSLSPPFTPQHLTYGQQNPLLPSFTPYKPQHLITYGHQNSLSPSFTPQHLTYGQQNSLSPSFTPQHLTCGQQNSLSPSFTPQHLTYGEQNSFCSSTRSSQQGGSGPNKNKELELHARRESYSSIYSNTTTEPPTPQTSVEDNPHDGDDYSLLPYSKRRRFSQTLTISNTTYTAPSTHLLSYILPTRHIVFPLAIGGSNPELQQLLSQDPWTWDPHQVFVLLSNIFNSPDFPQRRSSAILETHLGIIAQRYKPTGPQILVHLTQATLTTFQITLPKHQRNIIWLIDRLRTQSPSYKQYTLTQPPSYQTTPSNNATLAHPSTKDLAAPTLINPFSPFPPHSLTATLLIRLKRQIHEHVTIHPLRKDEKRQYHFVSGCFLASQRGEGGNFELVWRSIEECLRAGENQGAPGRTVRDEENEGKSRRLKTNTNADFCSGY